MLPQWKCLAWKWKLPHCFIRPSIPTSISSNTIDCGYFSLNFLCKLRGHGCIQLKLQASEWFLDELAWQSSCTYICIVCAWKSIFFWLFHSIIRIDQIAENCHGRNYNCLGQKSIAIKYVGICVALCENAKMRMSLFLPHLRYAHPKL